MKRAILINTTFCLSLVTVGCAGSEDSSGDSSDPTADDGANDGAQEDSESGNEDTNDDSTAGEEESGDQSESGDESSGEPGDVLFADAVLPIIGARCGCHRSGTPAAGLDLNDDAAFDSLVGAPSGVAPINLVEPGSSDDSYVIAKLNGSHVAKGGAGGQMPLGGELSAEEMMIFEAWVDGGALP